MIILIRHGQSEGNKNREIHQSVPDHRVQLTPEGHKQALDAGRRLRELLRPDDTLHFYTSPYRRARETTEGILESLTSDDPSPSPFPRHTIKVYEEPRLREQDFGNFQPCSAEMSRMWQERADYGHFFYRIPNGESAADAYDRVSGFNESLWRLFGEDSFASVCVLVTHGLMTRVFLMKWYHFSVEYFEDLRNINHCEFVIMEKNPDNGKYILQNKLRTWSALRKEKEEERKQESITKGITAISADAEVPVRRKWGGCPNGCKHGESISTTWRPTRRDEVDVFRDDDGGETTDAATGGNASASAEPRKGLNRMPSLKDRRTMSSQDKAKFHLSLEPQNPDDIVSSPNQTPSYIGLGNPSQNKELAPRGLPPNALPNIHSLILGGRDGGGSTSGVNSADISGSESDGMLPEKRESLPALHHSHNLAHHHTTHQEDEDDGDDEGAAHSRRSRKSTKTLHHSHNHHHGHHSHTHHNTHTNSHTINDRTDRPNIGDKSSIHRLPRKVDLLGDMADDVDTVDEKDNNDNAGNDTYDDNHENSNTNTQMKENDTQTQSEFERLRREEESVSGSVY